MSPGPLLDASYPVLNVTTVFKIQCGACAHGAATLVQEKVEINVKSGKWYVESQLGLFWIACLGD